MSIFIGSNAGETITPDTVSGSVKVVGGAKKPSNAADIIFAGGGNDTVAGGGGSDLAFLGAGNDTFIWNGGDGNDVVVGDGGFDTLKFNGANLNEEIEVSSLLGAVSVKGSVELQGQRLSSNLVLESMERIDIATLGGADNINVKNLSGTDVKEVVIDLTGTTGGTTGDGALDQIVAHGSNTRDVVEVSAQGSTITVDGLAADLTIKHADANDRLTIKGNGGDDLLSAVNVAAGSMLLTFDGGSGNDIMHGSGGHDTFLGGEGDDFVDGNRGDDVAYMGDGDDTFVWNPGEGNDVVEGGDGFFDAMDFVGNGTNENVEIAANGERVRFFRDVANVTMDLNDVERILFSSLGGTDNIHVGDLKGTDIENVTIEMSTTRDSLFGDGAQDVVTVDGSADDDSIDVSFANGVADVNLFHNFVNLLGIESGDRIVVNGGAGDDSIAALNVQAGAPSLVLDGGAGDDFILGSDNADTLIGGDGDDIIDGERGDDVAFLGAGDDQFVWDPGEGSDVVEGGDGFDTMVFNGAGANEPVDISANGERARFFRQPGNITMDLNDVERITFNALGGTDDITIRDLSGTDIQEVEIDLAGELFGTTGDGQVDQVKIEGSSDGDQIDLLNFDGAIAALGTTAFITIRNGEATDRLILSGGVGDDSLSASSSSPLSMSLTFDGGVGDDTLFGSQNADLFLGGEGDDFVTGNRGDDVAQLGAGNDFFIWNPGDGSDVVEGGSGTDFLGFRGANVAENIEISADGERVKLVRDVANVTMDLNDVERMTLNTFGGVDNVKIGDLSGTDMQDIELSLLNSGVPNDGVQDNVTIDGSASDDTIDISTANLQTSIDGLTAHVSISGADRGLDRLTIDAGAGNDAINASALSANLFQFSILGGAGDDAIIGSDGNDTIAGGSGDDVVSGAAGNDAIDGGEGFDILLGGLGDDLFLNGELIQDFQAGAGSDDRIDVRGLGLSFDWIVDHATDIDGSTLLDFGDSELLLAGVATTSLHQDDFLLA